MTAAPNPDRAAALIARIEGETEAERARIRSEAEAEAAGIVKAAHARARDRVHREIEALRRSRADALRDETARLDTARRQLRQREARAEIEAGLPALADALSALWADKPSRLAWARAAVAMAGERLTSDDWTIAHPKGWRADEKQMLSRTIEAITGKDPAFEADAALTAGLRIGAGGAWLDASAAALMADPEATGAALLAEIAREREDAG